MTEIVTVEGINTLIWHIWNNKTYSCGLACKHNFVFIKFMLLVIIKILQCINVFQSKIN